MDRPVKLSERVKTRRGSRHDRTGCITCRHRRKKCNENIFPICGTCARLNLECIREPIRNVVPAKRAHKAHAPAHARMAASWNSPCSSRLVNVTPMQHPPNLHSRQRHAMSYYITTLTQHATVSERYNSFLSAFLPMAMESKALWNSLSSWALGHLSLSDNSYTLSALETRSLAMGELTLALNKLHGDLSHYETNAAACLALVISDVGQGEPETWYNHLVGAKGIIACAQIGQHHGPNAFKQTVEGQWILRNFAYHDILASVTMGRPPLLDGSYLDGITDVVDSCLGVGADLLKHISDISLMNAELSAVNPQFSESEIITRCTVLEGVLANWSCTFECPANLFSIAHACRAATQVILYRTRRKASTQCSSTTLVSVECHWQTKIDEAVMAILDNIRSIPVGSIEEAPLVFPLFIAGAESTDEVQQDCVRSRLLATLNHRKFRNILRALEVLEILWEKRKALISEGSNEQVDWSDVLDQLGGGLVLT